MSNTPKYSSVQINAAQQEQLEKERRLKAEEEAQQRKEAEKRELRLRTGALRELHALIAGLKVDPIVMRWRAGSVRALEDIISGVDETVSSSDLHDLLSEFRSKTATIVEEANHFQLQADKRDYIAESIGSTLHSMRFKVAPPQREYPDNPSSALVIRATNAANKTIAVSVPFEGNLLYSVDQSWKSLDKTIDGGVAHTCDEAEEIINTMKTQLAGDFAIETGQLHWRGKVDPTRILTKARRQLKPKRRKKS